MGGKSTSHSVVLSGKKTSKSSGFDLHSWQGLTEVLKRGKESLQDADSYADFRNLVLEYAQGGGDAELRKQIDKVIASFIKENTESQKMSKHSDKTTKKTEVQKKKKHAHHVVKSPEDTTNTTDTTNIPKQETVSYQKHVSSVVEDGRTKLSFKAKTPQQATSEVKQTPTTEPPTDLSVIQTEAKTQSRNLPSNTTQITTPPKVSEKIDIEPQASLHTSNKTQESEAIPFKSIEEYKIRIVEIKRRVHEQIGNPVALLNTHNKLGKEYMMTLLSALKSLGAGNAESPDRAMLRLENAFKALIEAPTEPEKEKPKPKPKVERKEVIRTSPPAEVREKTERKKPIQNIPTSVSDKSVIKPTTQPQHPVPKPSPTPTPVKPKSKPPAPEQKPVASVLDLSHREKVIDKKEDKISIEHTEEKKPREKLPKIKIAPQTKRETEPEKAETTNNIPKSKLSPSSTLEALLIKEEPLDNKKSIKSLKKIETDKNFIQHTKFIKKEIAKNRTSGYEPLDAVNPAKFVVKQTELSTLKVTDALNKLLHEWSLFKSSGLLGIGPSGSEHLLYRKLAILSMDEVVAGRWEGSDRKITKIIREYIDAWRHEQGISYSAQETFEHYLRRVVLRIQRRKAEDD